MHENPEDAEGTLGSGQQSNAVLDSNVPQPADATEGQKPRLPFAVVGVGASAGGLEAYGEFLKHTRADSGMAFVLIQHLSPRHESLMAELLAVHTAMPVIQVEDGMEVVPDHVYVIRPGFTMTIRDGRLHLGASAALSGHRRPIDDFFRSLAEEQRERAIVVILSGTGSNGTAGAGAIKAVGGLCVAQNPDSAKFSAMPRSLIDSGFADAILEPAEMFNAIQRFAAHAYSAGGGSDATTAAMQERLALSEVIAVLQSRVRQDFSGYKKPTIIRRVQRRMSLLQLTRINDYVRALRQTPGEVRALADDLLIHVTGFFRDPAVWDAMTERVIRPLVAGRADGEAIRCWVTACSTGEEAYTLGILLLEAAHAANKRFDIKIFATDMAERSLGHARAGLFAGGIESELTPERLKRWFDRDEISFRVKKELRELVVFAPQNVLQDPPFSRLDIASCRNFLIYVEADVQHRVLQMLHFGLRDDGVLLLGTSETIGDADHLFTPIEKKLRIYRRNAIPRRETVGFLIPPSSGLNEAVRGDGDDPPEPRLLLQSTLAQLTSRALLERHTPAALVIDRSSRIVYFHGSTSRYLDQPRGEPTRDVLDLAHESVRGALRVAIQRATAQNEEVCQLDGTIGEGADRRRIEIRVAPLDPRAALGHLLITFNEREEPRVGPAAGEPTPDHAEVAGELVRVREELQSTIEELQASNEEMKASHEEITSVNEELQSSNEELETSKEELQSLNEELTTVNAQLGAKMEELERTSNDLHSLLSSTDIAVVFLDTSFRIRRFTPAIKPLVDLIPADLGRPLSDLKQKFVDAQLPEDMRTVLRQLVPIEREIDAEGGRGFIRRALPYRTGDNRIEGIVVTFVDVTARRRIEAALRVSEERHRALVSDAPVGICETDLAGRLISVNERLCSMVGRRREDPLVGLAFADLVHPSDRAAAVAPFAQLLADGRSFESEVRLAAPAGADLRATLFASVTRDASDAITSALAVFVDVTARRDAETALVDSESRCRALADVGHDLLWQSDLGGKTVWCNERWHDYVGRLVDREWRYDWLDAVHRDEREAAGAALLASLATGEALRCECRLRAADGTYRWFLVQVRPDLSEAGKVFRWFGAATDVNEQRVSLDALRESEARFRMASDASKTGFWDWDVRTGQMLWDETHNRICGLPPGQRVGSRAEFTACVHPDDRVRLSNALERCAHGGLEFREEMRVVHPDGSTHWIAGEGRGMESADGTIPRIVGIVTDVTDRKRSEADLAELLRRERSARGDAEAANTTKDRFLANASHELRTPLSAILIWTKLLSKTLAGSTSKEVVEALDAIERSADAQKQLIDDLLDSSRITSGKMRLDVAEIDLGDVVRSAADSIRPTALGKPVTLTFDVAADVGVVWADPDRVRQMVWNLLANAVRFTPAGGRIAVDVMRREGVVVIRVADTGVGIDAEFLPRVFERFRQADVSSSRSTGGLGLGLAIVKELVELHSGTIRVESAGKDQGTAFTIELPLARLE